MSACPLFDSAALGLPTCGDIAFTIPFAILLTITAALSAAPALACALIAAASRALTARTLVTLTHTSSTAAWFATILATAGSFATVTASAAPSANPHSSFKSHAISTTTKPTCVALLASPQLLVGWPRLLRGGYPPGERGSGRVRPRRVQALMPPVTRVRGGCRHGDRQRRLPLLSQAADCAEQL